MIRWRLGTSVALFSGLCLLVGLTTAFAESKNKENKNAHKNETNAVHGPQQEKEKVTPQAESVHQIALAHELAQYGLEHKSPEALIVAAEILGNVPASSPLKEQGTKNPKDDPSNKNT